MASVSISPIFNGQQFFDNNGLPLSGGQLWQYQGGSTSVLQTTYTTSAGNIANANPIVLDSSGRIPTELWLTNGQVYNLVLTKGDGTTVLTFVDGVTGVQASTGGVSNSVTVWNQTVANPTYINATNFQLSGDYRTAFAVGNRVQVEYGAGVFSYATVSNVVYTSPNTQVTVVNDTSSLNSGMSKVYWSVLVTTGRTVDAGAVTYAVSGTYTTANTVGNAINSLNTTTAATNLSVAALNTVWPAVGSGLSNFVVTVTPAPVSYTAGQIYVVKFSNASVTAATVNVNGLGAKPLVMYSNTGTTGAPIITANMVSTIAYDGTNFILLNQLPAVPGTSTVAPHGQVSYTYNSTFTVPANVYHITATVVGAGGGGGGAYFDSGSGITYAGGQGGHGAVSVVGIDVSPGQVYAITIGTGGAGAMPGAAGSTGGSSQFGIFANASGGVGGMYATLGAEGAKGANGVILVGSYGYGVGTWISDISPVGQGGLGNGSASTASTAGSNGFCVVSW